MTGIQKNSASMLDSPSILSVPEQSAAIIRMTVPRSEIRDVMPAAIRELRSVMAEQGIAPSGPMFSHHLVMDLAVFDLEVGFPVDGALVESGRVRPGSLPAANVVRATYRGGYEGLATAWGELREWIEASGHRRAADLWESYVSGPETGQAPSAWRTELNQRLVSAARQSDPDAERAGTTVERASERELIVTRTFDGPARIVFEAWAKPELFQRWWVPKSFCVTLISYEADIRTGGAYRLVMGHPSSEQPMAFFGRYIEVTPHARIIWTNDEGGEGGAVTTVTFEESDSATRVVVHELHASKDALDDAMASGSTSGWDEQFKQLDDLMVTLTAEA